MANLIAAATETLLGYLRLGNEVMAEELVTFVRNPACSEIRDANHGAGIRARTYDEAELVLTQADEALAPSAYRSFKVTPDTDPSFETRLLLDDYRVTADLEMALDGPVQATPPEVDIRPVTGEADWSSIRLLKRADDEDHAARTGAAAWPSEVSEQMLVTKRAKAPEVAYFLARVDGVDCAYFSSWPGVDGVGVVEDLFTLPQYRRRGIATALICHCVADARARGAATVLIGADPDDTPKALYARLGFRPLLIMRNYWRQVR